MALAKKKKTISKTASSSAAAYHSALNTFTFECVPVKKWSIDVPSIDWALKDLAARSFKEFVSQAIKYADPAVKYLQSWATDCMCDHLQAIAEGDGQPFDPGMSPRIDPIRFLIINVPPRSLKSTITTVLFPAWVWINKPSCRFMITSYSHKNIKRDARKCRGLIKSLWYQARWGDKFGIICDSDTIERYDNNKGGFRYAVSVTGQVTGEGADIIIADDLHQMGPSIHSKVQRDRPNEIWDDVFSSRLSDQKTGCFVLISQRGHARDHTGHVLEKDTDKEYVHVAIPAEYESKFKCVTRLPWEDPRTKEGELIDVRRFGPKEIAKLKKDMGSWNAAAQLQQRPVPVEGAIFERDWWRFYNPASLPPFSFWENCCISADMSFGSVKDSASFVVYQAWAKIGANFYLLDQARGQWKYTIAKKNLVKFCRKHNNIWTVYVENKALGPAIINELEEEGVSGLMPVEPDGSKIARASSISPLIEAGNCYIPDPLLPGFGWVESDFLAEVDLFPMAAHDDIVDTMSQAVRKLRGGAVCGVGSDDAGDIVDSVNSHKYGFIGGVGGLMNGVSLSTGELLIGNGISMFPALGEVNGLKKDFVTTNSSDDDFWGF